MFSNYDPDEVVVLKCMHHNLYKFKNLLIHNKYEDIEVNISLLSNFEKLLFFDEFKDDIDYDKSYRYIEKVHSIRVDASVFDANSMIFEIYCNELKTEIENKNYSHYMVFNSTNKSYSILEIKEVIKSVEQDLFFEGSYLLSIPFLKSLITINNNSYDLLLEFHNFQTNQGLDVAIVTPAKLVYDVIYNPTKGVGKPF